MAELHIDSDWKKQAQEEKRKLAEEEAKKKAAAPPGGAAGEAAGGGAAAKAGGRPRRGAGEVPEATFASLVQSLMTQALYYMGDLAARGERPVVDLDMAKRNIDLLGILDGKCRGNLSADEQSVLDTALYEVRMRFVAIAQQYIAQQ